MSVPSHEETSPEDDSSALARRLLKMSEGETPHLIGGELIWANRDDEEVDAELYEMELNARDD